MSKGIEFLPHTLSNSYNLATHSPRHLIFQTINSVRSKNQNLKYQRFTPSDCKDIKCEFVATNQFLCVVYKLYPMSIKNKNHQNIRLIVWMSAEILVIWSPLAGTQYSW